jgi:hypothetical protein
MSARGIVQAFDARFQNCHKRVNNDEDGARLFDSVDQDREVCGQGERGNLVAACDRIADANKGDKMNAWGIATGGLDAGFDDIGDGIFGGDEDDITLYARGAIGHGLAGSDTGSEVEREEGFAEARLAVEDGQFAVRDTAGPEPVEWQGLVVWKGFISNCDICVIWIILAGFQTMFLARLGCAGGNVFYGGLVLWSIVDHGLICPFDGCDSFNSDVE